MLKPYLVVSLINTTDVEKKQIHKSFLQHKTLLIMETFENFFFAYCTQKWQNTTNCNVKKGASCGGDQYTCWKKTPDAE